VQLIIDKVDAVSRDYGLEVSAQKSKIMVVAVRVTCSGVLLEMLDTFCYLEFKTCLGITATTDHFRRELKTVLFRSSFPDEI